MNKQKMNVKSKNKIMQRQILELQKSFDATHDAIQNISKDNIEI